ncbi:LysE family translocator [Ideonella sp. DXS22W]|uniref:LysE family translocator n=1 Tax=Pseudaquabacterium inlustre TaxID=2984192 RepID=A0ABU9CLH3_9BURK
MDFHTGWLLLAAAIGLSLTPGPNSLLVLTHGALHGHRRTLWTVAGGALGFVALIALSLAGIGALLKASAGALIVLKWVGGAYLVWLGVQLWRAPPIRLQSGNGQDGPGGPAADGRPATLFRQGLLTAVSNPKALLFYGAFLPQFIDGARPLLPQFITMAVVFGVVECLVEIGLAMLAHRVRPWLERLGRRFNRACGGMFVAMGAALPMTR